MLRTLHRRQAEGRSRRGFALLMALVLLALAAVLLTRLARYSLSLAAECGEARQELQRRWGTTSLSRAVLPRADQILSRLEQLASEQGEPTRQCFPISETVRLGDIEFQLLLDDENRKLSVNRAYATRGQSGVSWALQLLGQRTVTVRLRPYRSEARGFAPHPFDSYGQIYALERLPAGEDSAEWLMANTETVTCWGNGRIHYARAPDRVLAAVASQVAGPVTASRLVALRNQDPQLELDELLDGLAVSHTKKIRLRGWLTDQSRCFSLWICARTPDRSWYELVVAELSTNESLRTNHFAW